MAGRQASAVIVRARLPPRLERRRRRSIGDAAEGVPAHLTLLYPFVGPGGLDVAVRRTIATVAARHAPFEYRLDRTARWPDTIYVAVAPVEPFIALQADLAKAFPDYPIYGEPPGFTFVPHVTIAEGSSIHDPATTGDAGRTDLPRPARAMAIEVIASHGHDWRLVWRVRLGHRGHR